MTKLFHGALWALLIGAAPLTAARAQQVQSPDKSIEVQLRVNGEGRPEYNIRHKGRLLVDWSRLGERGSAPAAEPDPAGSVTAA